MKKILFVTSCAYYGGAFEVLAQLILALRSSFSITPILACQADFAEKWAKEHNVVCRRISFARVNSKEGLCYLGCVCDLTRILMRDNVDAIYANHLLAGVNCWPAARITRTPMLAACLELHSADDFWRWERRILQHISRITVLSRAIERSLRPIVGEHPEIILIGTFLSQEDRNTASLLLQEEDALRSVAVDKPVFGMVSRIAPDKRQDLGLRLFSAVLKVLPSARMLIAGTSNTPQQAAFEARLHALVREMGIERHVDFIGFQEDMPAVYKRLDILISPSPEEAFGRVIIEAYAHGLPVVAFKGGGSAEVISDRETGWIFDPLHPEAGVEDVLQALRMPNRYAKMRRRCLELAVQKYGGADEVQHIASLLGIAATSIEKGPGA